GDAPGGEHALLGPVAAKRLVDRVREQVLDLDRGEVAGAERLVVLPQPIGDLRDGASRDDELPGRVSEGVLDVAGGKPPRVHLGDETFEHLGVALQELDELRAVGSLRAPDLGRTDRDLPFGHLEPVLLVAVPPPGGGGPGALVAPSAEEVLLLLLESLLDHVLQPKLRERRQDVGPRVDASAQQLVDLLAHHGARRYSPHGLGLLSVDLRSSELKLRPLRVYRDARTSPSRHLLWLRADRCSSVDGGSAHTRPNAYTRATECAGG